MKCTKCEAYNNIEGINCQRYFGTPPCTYLFYGEMFGKEECKRKEPFVGRSGDILTNLLGSIGLKKSDVCISNVCKCYIENNKTPSKHILDACFIHITREIREIDPKLIIALGASATYSLTGIPVDEFKNYKGKKIFSKKINRDVYIINHPAAMLHNPNKKEEIEKDFLRIPEVLNEKPFEKKYYEHEVIDTQEKFNKMFNILLNNQMLFDMEMEGLDCYNYDLNIRTMQLGLDDKHIYILIPEIIFSNIENLRILFETNPIIGQDFSFDAKWLYVRLGILIKNWEHDLCLAEYLISGMKNNDLDYITSKYNSDYHGYWDEVKKLGGAHKVQDKKLLYNYGGSDVGTMYPSHIKQQKILFRTNQYDFFRSIMMPCNKVLTKMSLRGVKIDLDTLWKIDSKYKKRAQKSEYIASTLPGISECERHFNKKFNHRSTQMLRWLLLDYYKLPVLKSTKATKTHPDGQPQISQKEMEIYAKKYNNKYCKIMEKYRSIQTIRKNFLSGSVPKLKNGIAHTTYSLHSTTTGRPNSRDPNLLNIPREKDIKRCYVARDGHKFVYGDEAQLEVRISAVVYKEPKLLEICNDLSKDIHSNITAKAFKKDYNEVYTKYKADDKEMTELRVKGKAVQFGVIYQQQADSLAYSLNISKREAQRFIDDYYENFPDLYYNIEKTKKKIIKQGHLYNYFNFLRTWKNHTEEDHGTLREGVNFLIQSLAFNLIQIAMIKIDEEFERRNMKSALVLQVYDSIVSESPYNEVDEAAFIMKNIMENVNKPYKGINQVLLSTDIEVGNNLAEMEKYKL